MDKVHYVIRLIKTSFLGYRIVALSERQCLTILSALMSDTKLSYEFFGARYKQCSYLGNFSVELCPMAIILPSLGKSK